MKDIEDIEKYSQKNVRIVYKSFVCVWGLLFSDVWLIFSMWLYEDTCTCGKFDDVFSICVARCVVKVATDWLSEKMFCLLFFHIFSCSRVCVCVVMIFTKEKKYHHHCITKKIKFWFVSIIDEDYGGSDHNKYRGDETCFIIIYNGVLCYISILCWNMICVRLQ